MKLRIEFHEGKRIATITDDRGEPMPCIRSVDVRTKYDGVSEVTITLLCDGRNVVLGAPKE